MKPSGRVILAVGFVSIVAIYWAVHQHYHNLLRNTKFADGFTEKEFHRLAVGAPAETVIETLGLPFYAGGERVDETNGAAFEKSVGSYDGRLDYTTSLDGTDQFIYRSIWLQEGRITAIQCPWGL